MYKLTAKLQTVRLQGEDSATRRALMEAGEYLMGEQGLEIPPLHVIAGEAGTANKYAVQYHFGDRKGLVQAILNARSRAIQLRRAELALEATASGLIEDVGALVEAMFLPTIEQIGAREPSSFVRFLQLALGQPWDGELMAVRQDVQDDPHSNQLQRLFQQALPHLSPETVGWRLRIQTRMILNCLVEHDNLRRMKHTVEADRDLILGTFAMATAAMTA